MTETGNICRVYMRVMDPKRVKKLLGSAGDVEITKSTISYFAYFNDAKLAELQSDERIHSIQVLRRDVDYATFNRYCAVYRKFVGGVARGTDDSVPITAHESL